MVTLQNTTKAVKVLKAIGMPTLRVIPGFNYVDISESDMAKYTKTEVNRAVIKESIKLVDIELDEVEEKEAKSALAINKKLNKAQRVIEQQNKQILKKDEANNSQATVIEDLIAEIAEMKKELNKFKKEKK